MWLTSLIRALDAWALPPVCVLCGEPGAVAGFDMCAACESELPGCDEPAGAAPPLDHLWSAFSYEYPVAGLVRELKFGGQVAYARVLGLACLRRWPRPAATDIDALLPVPLHIARLRARGFNQAYEIARLMARGLQVPLLERSLRRRRATLPQTTLTAASRPHNVRGAFDLTADVAGLRIGVLDDVLTTGATLREIALVLKAGGATRVVGMTVARAAHTLNR